MRKFFAGELNKRVASSRSNYSHWFALPIFCVCSLAAGQVSQSSELILRAGSELTAAITLMGTLSSAADLTIPSTRDYDRRATLALQALRNLRTQSATSSRNTYALNDMAFSLVHDADQHVTNFSEALTSNELAQELWSISTAKTIRSVTLRRATFTKEYACEKDIELRLLGQNPDLCSDAMKKYNDLLDLDNQRLDRELKKLQNHGDGSESLSNPRNVQ